MKKAFLIKYGEIALKGKNRYMFENILMDQIRHRIEALGVFKVQKEQGRIFVEPHSDYEEQEVLDAIKEVFGIAYICPVVVIERGDFEEIKTTVTDFVKQQYPTQDFTFKVEARRAVKSYPVTSMEICREVGAHLLNVYPELKVDVHNPEVRIWIEVRDRTYIYSKMIKGLGGMPVGSNGRAMLLLSGGIDSPVAGYMIAKRGVAIDAVYFHSHPYTSERAKQKVIDLARIISRKTGPIRLHIVPFTEIQLAIYEQCPHEQLTIIMRRVMMAIAEAHAKYLKALALVTGESIGQVASQTIHSLVATNAVCTMPVFRPLIGFDKQEIVDISEKIDAYETSILPYEDCCTVFVAKHPVTKPKLEAIEKSEKNLKDIDSMIKKAIEDTEVIKIKPGQ
ncbi:tRNA 4-thiouridine(8) synthase ThiI [Vallitaleaceae bacterium 9-2]